LIAFCRAIGAQDSNATIKCSYRSLVKIKIGVTPWICAETISFLHSGIAFLANPSGLVTGLRRLFVFVENESKPMPEKYLAEFCKRVVAFSACMLDNSRNTKMTERKRNIGKDEAITNDIQKTDFVL